MEKYLNIATEVANNTSVTVHHVINTISHMTNTLIEYGYSREQIEEKITTENVENIVSKRISRGSIK